MKKTPLPKDPDDRLPRRRVVVTRDGDGRERHAMVVTYGGHEALFIVLIHPGTGVLTTPKPQRVGANP